ncbi:site-2 protease family protein [Granulicella arctica]|uniref:Zn-dependent protease n=1 Tax=Granulicella arctica TaxID=940613 RepID=A0A7Y9PE52_9BACT|nr:site-2 protease family protein [Granulicella arctica]NYF78241.1 Zn-dependent protease [Granulicella arctica]
MGLFQPVVLSASARVCPVCQAELRSGELACPRCQTLVHRERLDAISKEALELERAGSVIEARELWRSALPLLPKGATQADWIRQHLRELDERIAGNAKTAALDRPQGKPNWTKRLGPLAPIAVVLAKLKTFFFLLLKLKFLLSFALFLGVYWTLFGPWFGVGFAVQILIHELGHVAAVKRNGLKADLPVFLPGLGAYVRWQGFDISVATRAEIALAGPLFGLFAAAGCMGLYLYTRMPVFAALAHAGAWLNLINLIPVWMLDGGQAVVALSRVQRGLLLAACVLFFALTDQKVFLLVAAGMVYRLFTKDTPEEPDTRTMVFFVLLLFALGALLKVIPMQPGRGF